MVFSLIPEVQDSPHAEILKHIHPLQQVNVHKTIQAAINNPCVKSIRIFGSAVTNKCHRLSDIDLAVECSSCAINEPCVCGFTDVLSEDIEHEYDCVFLSKVSKTAGLYSEIMKGLIVYEQNASGSPK